MTVVSTGVAGQMFIGANLALILAYLALPLLVVPYLSFRRRTKAAFVAFFLGCVFSHGVMLATTLLTGTVHHGTSDLADWVIAIGHAGQAVGSWAAVIWARGDLERADAFLLSFTKRMARS